MEHDIRELFKETESFNKKLPKNHRDEFIRKLNNQKQKKEFFNSFLIAKIAAVFVIVFSVYQFINSEKSNTNNTKVEAKVKELEKEYYPTITKEWDNFLKIAKDSKLVDTYKKKLNDSKQEYEELLQLIKKDEENFQLLQSLINNLQKRLLIINEINNHIKDINTQKISNETIII